MLVGRLAIVLEMTLRRLLRNRVAVILLLIVPVVFQTVMLKVAPDRAVEVELASVPESEMVMPPVRVLPARPVPAAERGAVLEAPARGVALIFVTVAAVGMLAAFLGLSLMQRGAESTRRLVLCGLRPWEILTSKLVALLCVVVALAGVASVVLLRSLGPERPGVLLLGLMLTGWVYGCYGLLVGSTLRTGLAGMLCIVLLSNLDVMWLQNPVDYSEARTRSLIRSLPGHLPSQVCVVGAFEDYGYGRQALGAAAYGAALFSSAAVIFTWKSRTRRSRSPASADEAGPGPHDA